MAKDKGIAEPYISTNMYRNGYNSNNLPTAVLQSERFKSVEVRGTKEFQQLNEELEGIIIR